MNTEDLLYTNTFLHEISKLDNDASQQKQFRGYIEDKRYSQKRDAIIAGTPTNEETDRRQTFGSHKYDKVSVVALDTIDRDINMYPQQNDFAMYLGKKFLNVKEIKLISTEFPNTDQVIKNFPPQLQNNMVFWQNAEDINSGLIKNVTIQTITSNYVNLNIQGHGLTDNAQVFISNSKSTPNINGDRQITVVDSDNVRFYFTGGIVSQSTAWVDIGWPVYKIAIVPGNYTTDTLMSAISSKTNLIKRNSGFGKYHYFTLAVNNYTDVITFNSIVRVQLGVASLTSTAGTGIITVNQKSHGYINNQLITILGVSTFAGMDSTSLNGRFHINFIDNNTFSYEINVNAISSSPGGGNTINTGSGAPFRILFDSPNSTIQPNAGFPKEDSSVSLGNVNPLTTLTLAIESVQKGDPTIITTTVPHGLHSATVIRISSISVGIPTLITTLTPHLVTVPTRISIVHSNSSPSIDGEWLLVPLSPNTFEIDVRVHIAGTQGLVKYGGDQITLPGLKTLPNIDRIASFYVENATSRTFEIDISTNFVDQNSVKSSYIGTGLIFVKHPSHGFNQLTSVIQDTQDSKRAILTFQLPHGLTGTLSNGLNVFSIVSDTVDIAFVNHNLSTGNKIYITNSTCVPIIDGNYFVTVVDTNTLRVNIIGGVSVIGTANVATGAIITISRTNSVPAVDGNYNIQVIDTYTVKIVIVTGTGNTISGSSITRPGNYGILGRRNRPVLYRITSNVIGSDNIAGIPLISINGVYQDIVSLIDQSNYTIRVSNQFSNASVTSGGSNVHVSSEKHGYSDFQSNTVDGTASGSLYRSISLEGENYVYLVSPGLELGTVYNSSGIQNSFAKILLSEPPGNMMFNSFISAPAVFDSPIPYLDTVNFQVFTRTGYLYNFNDINFSFSLQITEIVDSLNVTNVSSQNADQISGISQTAYNSQTNQSFQSKKTLVKKK